MTVDRLSPKQRFEKENRPYGYFVLRPLGRLCLPWALRLGVTPNQVTIAALPFILAAMGLLAAGGVALSLAGALMLHVGLVLDNLDGDLARATGKTSIRGEYLDALIGYIYGALLLPAVGIGVSRAPDLGHKAISAVIDMPAGAYLQIGMWAGLVFVTSRLISLRFRIMFDQTLREGAGRLGRASLIISSSLPLLLVVGAATQLLGLLLIGYTIFYLLSLMYMIVGSYARAGSE